MVQIVNNFNADEKIMKYLDKLAYFFNGHKTLIVTELDLTNRCNNKCPGCCGVNGNGKELSRHQVDLVIKSIANIGGQGVILSGGGEPLISPQFVMRDNWAFFQWAGSYRGFGKTNSREF